MSVRWWGPAGKEAYICWKLPPPQDVWRADVFDDWTNLWCEANGDVVERISRSRADVCCSLSDYTIHRYAFGAGPRWWCVILSKVTSRSTFEDENIFLALWCIGGSIGFEKKRQKTIELFCLVWLFYNFLLSSPKNLYVKLHFPKSYPFQRPQLYANMRVCQMFYSVVMGKFHFFSVRNATVFCSEGIWTNLGIFDSTGKYK